MNPFGQYLGPERRGNGLSEEELAEAERMHRLRNRLGWVLLSMVSLLAVLSVINTFVAADRAEQNVQSNRLTQFTSCVENGNNLRQGLRNYISDQIQQTRQSDPELFPDIPPDVFARLIRERVKELRTVKSENFALVDCLHIYPPLEGQTYPDELLEQASRQRISTE